jgi:hypothetical protein
LKDKEVHPGRYARPLINRTYLNACPQQTGDGDLEELVEELNPGKVLYAYW